MGRSGSCGGEVERAAVVREGARAAVPVAKVAGDADGAGRTIVAVDGAGEDARGGAGGGEEAGRRRARRIGASRRAGEVFVARRGADSQGAVVGEVEGFEVAVADLAVRTRAGRSDERRVRAALGGDGVVGPALRDDDGAVFRELGEEGPDELAVKTRRVREILVRAIPGTAHDGCLAVGGAPAVEASDAVERRGPAPRRLVSRAAVGAPPLVEDLVERRVEPAVARDGLVAVGRVDGNDLVAHAAADEHGDRLARGANAAVGKRRRDRRDRGEPRRERDAQLEREHPAVRLARRVLARRVDADRRLELVQHGGGGRGAVDARRPVAPARVAPLGPRPAALVAVLGRPRPRQTRRLRRARRDAPYRVERCPSRPRVRVVRVPSHVRHREAPFALRGLAQPGVPLVRRRRDAPPTVAHDHANRPRRLVACREVQEVELRQPVHLDRTLRRHSRWHWCRLPAPRTSPPARGRRCRQRHRAQGC
mmetsp:Transcript_6259/g.18966  ORF Transcript_6259/g.18966 Transcript_6259/m.18966 type:complete len:481 (+) Transcript_6259:77-1519(+)